ncbi:MAG: site-specific integrase [Candidatus Rokubacteria bacterium]|nr:site-specific integrase [Candidatus Rokubacteria bacterium]
MGAIRKRGKHYAIRYIDALGRRRWETIGPNLQEARQVLAQRMWERRQGKFRLTRPAITMAEFAAKWDEDYLDVQLRLGRLKESTLVGYRCNLRLHIVPFFGRMRLGDITLPHVREFIKTLLGKGLAPKSVALVMVILKEMLKHAVQWGYLDANPAQYAERPRGEDKELEVLTPPEIRRLLAHAEEPFRTLLLCAVLTGMRRGELLGLKWEDIDLEGHRIHVRRALWKGKFVTPKSRRSRRSIDMAPALREALGRLPSRFRGELVFCTPTSTPLDADNLMHRDFPRALRRAGLRRIRFHDLRHTFTSLLIAQGAHPKYIQSQLGHASIQTTLDRYGHLMPDAFEREARKLDRLVFGGAEPSAEGRTDAPVQPDARG